MIKETLEPPPSALHTFFAPAERALPEVLEAEIAAVGGSAITDVILRAFGGILLILNQQRQAVAVNEALLSALGIPDVDSILGLRQGEILQCVHAEDEPGGCGTSKFCTTCGAAIAIVASAAKHKSVERECHLTTSRDGWEEAFEFRVRATPVLLGQKTFTAVTLQDIRAEKRMESLQRLFCHDLLNVIMGLQGSCELLHDCDAEDRDALVGEILHLSKRFAEETTTQRDLFLMEAGEFEVNYRQIDVRQIWLSLNEVFAHTGCLRERKLEMPSNANRLRITTSAPLLLRVLVNMTKNALEATPMGESVRLSVTRGDKWLTFLCWNPGEMSERVALRVFQRYFSTKEGAGRGLGTYSMRLIAERYLHGSVSFTTSENGTTFGLRIPLAVSPSPAEAEPPSANNTH